jgi:hypothetical protein
MCSRCDIKIKAAQGNKGFIHWCEFCGHAMAYLYAKNKDWKDKIFLTDNKNSCHNCRKNATYHNFIPLYSEILIKKNFFLEGAL